MVRERIVPHATVDGIVRVSGPFGAKLPDGPIVPMLGVEEADEVVQGVAVRPLRVGLRGTGSIARFLVSVPRGSSR